jgi:hypothetical protein
MACNELQMNTCSRAHWQDLLHSWWLLHAQHMPGLRHLLLRGAPLASAAGQRRCFLLSLCATSPTRGSRSVISRSPHTYSIAHRISTIRAQCPQRSLCVCCHAVAHILALHLDLL